MTPATPAPAPVTFPATITVVQRDTVTLEELSRVLKLSQKTLKRLWRDEGLPLRRIGANGPLFSRWSLVDEWIVARAMPGNGKAGK